MNIGLITVRGEDYHPNFRLIEAAREKGHRAALIHPYRIWPTIKTDSLGLSPKPDPMPDVVLPRQGATLGDTCLSLIRHFDLMGIPVINGADAIRLSKDKFLTAQTLSAAGIPVPETMLVNTSEGFRHAVLQLGGLPVVAKQISSRQGNGVMLIHTETEIRSMVETQLDRRTGLLVQRFIPPGRRREIRVLMIGKKPVGAMELSPNPGDFRANFHLTGKSKKVDLEPVVEALAARAADTIGLDIAGIDVMIDQQEGPYVIEVNYSPGFKGLEAATGVDVARHVVQYLWERIQPSSNPT
ncbi:MAG: RimK family alpha-L-glutamate ligase [Pseudomonadota bacterium]